MSVYRIDPIQDPRWGRFLLEHPRASVFHTSGWLETLRRTYGYEPFALTTSAPGRELTDGLVFCRINSRLTGRRWVSLPFSDHCDPLVDSPADLEHLLCAAQRDLKHEGLHYIEIRPVGVNCDGQAGFEKASRFWLHKIDLRPSLEELFRKFHSTCIQNKVRRAVREALSYEDGRSESLLEKLYDLLVLTRRRQRLPPQPFLWFRNLVDCMGDKVKIRVASTAGRPIAGILTLCYKDVLVYKYGCSDANLHHLGGMQFLFWRSIQEAKQDGMREFDLGRSDLDNAGLVTFKDRWGSSRYPLTYWQFPPGVPGNPQRKRTMQVARRVLNHMPDGFLKTAGNLIYRHIG